MADGAAAAGARVHLPHARLCLAAQPRGAPGAAARRRARSVRAPSAHGRRRRRRLRPLPLPRSALLQHRTLGATRAAAAVRRGRRPAERAERRLAGARLAVPPLPAAVRGGRLHAATTLQPRCNPMCSGCSPVHQTNPPVHLEYHLSCERVHRRWRAACCAAPRPTTAARPAWSTARRWRPRREWRRSRSV